MDATGRWIGLAGLNGLMAVAAGAFAAHAVGDVQTKALLHTGAQYQAVYAVAALACAGLTPRMSRQVDLAGWLFGAGGLVFGGSLYLLALSGARWLGAITPIGGLLMLAGWAVVIWGGLVGMRSRSP